MCRCNVLVFTCVFPLGASRRRTKNRKMHLGGIGQRAAAESELAMGRAEGRASIMRSRTGRCYELQPSIWPRYLQSSRQARGAIASLTAMDAQSLSTCQPSWTASALADCAAGAPDSTAILFWAYRCPWGPSRQPKGRASRQDAYDDP